MNSMIVGILGVGAVALFAFGRGGGAGPDTVTLCDGETQVRVAPGTAGTPESGRQIATALMGQWLQKNPGSGWQMATPAPAAQDPQEREALLQQRYQLQPPFDNRKLLIGNDGHPYGNFRETDVVIWERETRRLVVEGAEVFHDGGRLGSTIAVSCDMCHPDAANTHPETYPKYQTQIGKTVLLRDMINWCLQHPVRAPAMAEDDPRMKAMEAYILAQRKGKVLEYGKH